MRISSDATIFGAYVAVSEASPEKRTISAYALESGDLVTANLTRHRDDLEPTDEMRTLLTPYVLHY